MKVAGSMLRTTLAASAIALGLSACKGKDTPTETLKPPAKTELVGSYKCYRFLGFYKGSSGTGWYRGSCTAFVNVTNPSRRDSIEVQLFDVTSAYLVNRPDFETGTLAYDSATAYATINYSTGRASESYSVWAEGVGTLTRVFVPFDYTGDGQMDSLRLTYQKIY